MVCAKCEKKLTKLAAPDTWKEGSRSGGKAAGTKAVGQNKLLTNRARFAPYAKKLSCKTCKKALHQDGIYCNACAFQKGLCALCGKQTVDISKHKNVNS